MAHEDHNKIYHLKLHPTQPLSIIAPPLLLEFVHCVHVFKEVAPIKSCITWLSLQLVHSNILSFVLCSTQARDAVLLYGYAAFIDPFILYEAFFRSTSRVNSASQHCGQSLVIFVCNTSSGDCSIYYPIGYTK